MGWFRFVHEAFGMVFHRAVPAAPLSVLRRATAGCAGGNSSRCSKDQFKEMLEVMKFYGFMRPTPVSKIGHNAMAALSYVGIYALMLVEIVTGLVMYQRLLDNALSPGCWSAGFRA